MTHTIAAEIQAATKERGVFTYGDSEIHYDIVRKDESSPNAAAVFKRKVVIKVHPDQRVVATVPQDATKTSIHDAMLKRARWIWKNIETIAAQHECVLPKEYVSGETQFYLGKRYVLKVLSQPGEISQVKLLRGKLEVTLRNEKDTKSEQAKALVNEWYLKHARHVFYERLHAMLIKATWVKGIPSFRIITMKTQWGSCSSKGTLILNPHLIKAPKECIDYVILHELCHIAEHNHSERFWRLLTQVMPNWKEVKARLDDRAELYLNS